MSARLISQRYAKALLELAAKENAVERIQQELAALQSLVRGHADLTRLVEARLIAPGKKAAVFSQILTKSGGSDLLRRFFMVVAQAARLDLFHDIVASYARLVDARNGVVEALVTTAAPLSTPQEAELVRSLQQRTGRTIRVRMAQDARLLGGVKVQLGSTVYDATIDGRLRLLQAQLCSA